MQLKYEEDHFDLCCSLIVAEKDNNVIQTSVNYH